jgi:hypothetical protein
MIQAEFPNYHPLLSIARLAHHPDADLRLQYECHKTIAKYVEPELKSIEVKGEVKTEKLVRVSLFDTPQVIEDAVEVVPGLGNSVVGLTNW